jgi:hypothetical protein
MRQLNMYLGIIIHFYSRKQTRRRIFLISFGGIFFYFLFEKMLRYKGENDIFLLCSVFCRGGGYGRVKHVVK